MLWNCRSLSLDQLQTFTKTNPIRSVNITISPHRSLSIYPERFQTWESRDSNLWGNEETASAALLTLWHTDSAEAHESRIWLISLFRTVGAAAIKRVWIQVNAHWGNQTVTAESLFMVFLPRIQRQRVFSDNNWAVNVLNSEYINCLRTI